MFGGSIHNSGWQRQRGKRKCVKKNVGLRRNKEKRTGKGRGETEKRIALTPVRFRTKTGAQNLQSKKKNTVGGGVLRKLLRRGEKKVLTTKKKTGKNKDVGNIEDQGQTRGSRGVRGGDQMT